MLLPQVDWYPWGEEAFEKARTENKPIFLSVGYATCHWCAQCMQLCKCPSATGEV